MRSISPVRESGLQRYLSDALRRAGHLLPWDEYLLRLRRRPLSYQSVACEVYRELGLTIDATTLKRWLHGLELRVGAESQAEGGPAEASGREALGFRTAGL